MFLFFSLKNSKYAVYAGEIPKICCFSSEIQNMLSCLKNSKICEKIFFMWSHIIVGSNYYILHVLKQVKSTGMYIINVNIFLRCLPWLSALILNRPPTLTGQHSSGTSNELSWGSSFSLHGISLDPLPNVNHVWEGIFWDARANPLLIVGRAHSSWLFSLSKILDKLNRRNCI